MLASSLLLSSLAGLSALAEPTSEDNCCQSSNLKARVQSAQAILDDIARLETSMKSYHHQAMVLIAQSRKLQGEAEVLQTRTPVLPGYTKLTPAQYQAAMKQYNSDVEAFAAHAGAYDQHLQNFQSTIGECHANDQALNSIIKKYEIHVDQFHVPNQLGAIRPPHICKRMQAAFGDMSGEANSMLMDQKRVLEAQAALAKTEATLQNAEGEAPGVHQKAMTEARREQGEQALVAEFSRLKDEYDLLKVEKDRLAGNNSALGKVSRSSVSAKIKKK